MGIVVYSLLWVMQDLYHQPQWLLKSESSSMVWQLLDQGRRNPGGEVLLTALGLKGSIRGTFRGSFRGTFSL